MDGDNFELLVYRFIKVSCSLAVSQSTATCIFVFMSWYIYGMKRSTVHIYIQYVYVYLKGIYKFGDIFETEAVDAKW